MAGLFYGFSHQSSITATTRRAEADREYARQERLIEQARAEWKKKTQPQETNSTGSMCKIHSMHFRVATIESAAAPRAPLVSPEVLTIYL